MTRKQKIDMALEKLYLANAKYADAKIVLDKANVKYCTAIEAQSKAKKQLMEASEVQTEAIKYMGYAESHFNSATIAVGEAIKKAANDPEIV